MNSSLTIIKIGKQDIPLIRHLTFQVWPLTYKDILTKKQINYMLNMIYSEASLVKQMDEEGQQFIVVKDGDEHIAFASYGLYQPGIYKLHKIYALPDVQGKGIGRLIIDYIGSQIKPLGATVLQLNVNRHNKALGFYQKLGFKIIKEEDIDIGNGYFMNDYVMGLPLAIDPLG